MGCEQSKSNPDLVARPTDPPIHPTEENHPPAVKLETKEEPPVTVMAGKSVATPETVQTAEVPEAAAVPERFEVTACKIDEMQMGEMRHIGVPGQKQQVLLGKGYDGKYFAMGTACSHYNALLKNGVLSDDRIRCPWHGACFSTKTGDIEEYPCVDGVHIFEVQTNGNDVIVKGEAKNVDSQKRVLPMCKRNSESPDSVVIIGGGPSALICAETLRKENFSGKIVMLTAEDVAPYDRPKLSKVLDADIGKIELRKEEFLKEHDIELRKNTTVTSVDVANKTVSVGGSSESIAYTHLVIAVGQRVRRLSEAVTGGKWENIHYLRTLEDAKKLNEAGKGKRVAVLGSSFIGMEVAAYFADKAAAVTVISRTRVPYLAAFGPEVGECLKTELFDKKGVGFVPDVSITAYEGDQETGILKTVRLSNGDTVELDVLLAGIGRHEDLVLMTVPGTVPNTDFLLNTGLTLHPVSNALVVDEFMATNVVGVYGAGDCVDFPLATYDGVRCTIGHWNIAQSQGKTAALSIVGRPTPLHTVPYFWTMIFTKSIRFAGFGEGTNEVFIHGLLSGMKFVAYYLRDEKVVGAASLMYDPVVSRYAELIAKGAVITKNTILEDPELTKTAEKVFSVKQTIG